MMTSKLGINSYNRRIVKLLKKMLEYEYERSKKDGLNRIIVDKILHLKELGRLYETWKTGQGYKPLSINVYVTYRCNLKCKMCHIGKGIAPKALFKDEVTTERYASFFEEAGRLGTIKLHFTGGEPTLRSDLVNLVAHAKKHISYVNLTTNGTLLTKKLAQDLVGNGLDAIKFSIDGSKEAHDVARGVSGAWEKAIEGLRNINEAKRKLNSDVMVGVNCVISAIDYRTADDLLDKLHEIGNVDLVQFSPLISFETNAEDDTRMPLNKHEARFFGEHVIPKIKKKSDEYGISHMCSAESFMKDEITREKKTFLAKWGLNCCFLPWMWFILSPQGNIFPCGIAQIHQTNMSRYNKYVMGNIKFSTLDGIWNSDKYVNFRKKCNPLKHDMCNFCCHARSVKGVLKLISNLPLVNYSPEALQRFIAYLLVTEPGIASLFHKDIAYGATLGSEIAHF